MTDNNPVFESASNPIKARFSLRNRRFVTRTLVTVAATAAVVLALVALNSKLETVAPVIED